MNELKIEQIPIPETCPLCKKKVISKKPYCEVCDLFFGLEAGKKIIKGKCLYCSNEGKLSREHVLPKWISKAYQKKPKEGYLQITRPLKIDLRNGSDLHVRTDYNKNGPYDSVVYNVCTSCNGGWMNDLQRQAKPLVIKLTDGQWPEFTKTQCKILSRWSAMISLNFHSQYNVINKNEPTLLDLKNGLMPTGWKIYIARFEDSSLDGETFTIRGYVPFIVTDEPLSYNILHYNITYFCIERVMFFTVSTIGDHSSSFIKDDDFDINNLVTALNFRAIWPRQNSALKTKHSMLSYFDFLKLRNSFGR
jgi:hypothetical protein